MGSRASRLAVVLTAVLTMPLGLVASAQPCAAAPAAPRPLPLARPAVPPVPATPVAPVVDSAAVVRSVGDAVRGVSAEAQVGLVVWDRASDTALVSDGADTEFRAASLVKLLIALRAAPDPRNAARVGAMLRDSDDAVASLLWGVYGGDALPVEAGAPLGLALAPPDIPGRWGNTLLTPAEVLATYRHILVSAPALVEPMRAAPAIAEDGFEQHFGIPSAFAGGWAVKQAWGSASDHVAVHSCGLVDHDRLVVVLMTTHPPGTAFGTAAASVTAGARALASALHR